LLSKQQVARTAMELILGSTAIIDQLRSLMRDLSTPGTARFGTDDPSSWRLRSDVEARLLLGLGAAALWGDHRRHSGPHRRTAR
jgi:hypothetical protein